MDSVRCSMVSSIEIVASSSISIPILSGRNIGLVQQHTDTNKKLQRELTVFWHIGAFLIILVPWPMLDISRDKMRAELERVTHFAFPSHILRSLKTYPNVIYLMEEKRTFLMYTFDVDRIWFSLALLFASGGTHSVRYPTIPSHSNYRLCVRLDCMRHLFHKNLLVHIWENIIVNICLGSSDYTEKTWARKQKDCTHLSQSS